MNTQVFFLLAVGLVFLVYIARFVRARSVTRYSPGEVAGKLNSKNRVILLDVRTDRERSFQHIKGSLHIPLQQLRARAHELRPHQDREIVCYCQSDNRSLSAARILQKHGYQAASLRGGMVDWNFSRRPV